MSYSTVLIQNFCNTAIINFLAQYTVNLPINSSLNCSESGEAIQKHYHVILHYERVGKAESKFEAMQDTLMGNTVVENAKVTLIEIDTNLPVSLLTE
ncbi:hypothetical protein [Nostoc sp. UCD121]|uniref:hypothetical protein n=1 Tax=Nostoc sp. UCD121 TaxID=2681305 RepID=UPI001C891665|nr:hypothetical protein [Nostoc sp. UCD121]